MKKKLVLFDFDGTITTRDTLLEFLRFYKGDAKFLLGMIVLSPVLALYFLKLIPNWKAKQKCLAWFLGGENVSDFEAKCKAFTETVLPRLIRPKALAAIEEYSAQKATVAVVSASAESWIGPWCRQNGVVCVATQLEIVDGRITGRLCGENCYGPAKVKRIVNQFTLAEFDEIIAYGDSSGDREMFDLADQQFYKPFREKVTAATGSR